jgi:hypothetical protein
VERKFVQDLEARRDVKFYLKLPYWFNVPTPVGDYRPDWAIVMDGPETDGKPVLYLVMRHRVLSSTPRPLHLPTPFPRRRGSSSGREAILGFRRV